MKMFESVGSDGSVWRDVFALCFDGSSAFTGEKNVLGWGLMGFLSCRNLESCKVGCPCDYQPGQDKFWETGWYWGLDCVFSCHIVLHLSENYMIKSKWCLQPFINSFYIFSKTFFWQVCLFVRYNIVIWCMYIVCHDQIAIIDICLRSYMLRQQP